MLQVKQASSLAIDAVRLRDSSLFDLLSSLNGLLRRQRRVFLLLIPCALALGLLYVFLTPPIFKAKGALVIDTRPTQASQPSMAGGNAAEKIQTEIEIIKSPRVSLAVIKDLGLTEDPEFVGRSGIFAAAIKLIERVLTSSQRPSYAQLPDQVLAAFENMRTVSRVGQSDVIEIEFQSLDPAKSARIVNAIAESYFNEELEAKVLLARRTGTWLQGQIDQLRSKVMNADHAVVDFKRANGIVENSNGSLMNEQQVSELNIQLTLARTAKAEAKAKLERIKYLMSRDLPDASVADALHNEVIIRSRNQYLEIAARARAWEAQYGANHLATVNLRTQMAELLRNINDEMKQIEATYKSDYEIAIVRERDITNILASAIFESDKKQQAQIHVRELESTVQNYRTSYESFLTRYMDSLQQQSFPIADARLIGSAIPPKKKSQPNTFLILIISLASGLMLSFAVAFYRELSDRSFRTRSQIEEGLGINCIAILPSLELPSATGGHVVIKKTITSAGRTIARAEVLLRYAVDAPFSYFTEELRSLKVSSDFASARNSNKVIGMTSTLPNEGKSTIASNFAHLIAHAGDRTILIDCDLRSQSLSRKLVPAASAGLIEIVAGKIELGDAIWTEPSTGLCFLPTGSVSNFPHANKLLASKDMIDLIDRLREMFDYLIVDFPPLLSVSDARASAYFIDSYVYIVEWGCTKSDVVARALQSAPEIRGKLLGVIVNKSDACIMSRYERHGN